jgi:hypothetical protein
MMARKSTRMTRYGKTTFDPHAGQMRCECGMQWYPNFPLGRGAWICPEKDQGNGIPVNVKVGAIGFGMIHRKNSKEEKGIIYKEECANVRAF